MTTPAAPSESPRLAGAEKLPAFVLRRYHSTFVRTLNLIDSEGFNDLVSDGLLLLVQLDRRLPSSVSPREFFSRAVGHLKLYYRGKYQAAVGIYRDRNGIKRDKKFKMSYGIDPDRQGGAWVMNNDLLTDIEADDFITWIDKEEEGKVKS